MTVNQCDQIGLFSKNLCDKFSNKSSPNIWKLFGLGCLKGNFVSETIEPRFWATYRENWATLSSNIWSHCQCVRRSRRGNFCFSFAEGSYRRITSKSFRVGRIKKETIWTDRRTDVRRESCCAVVWSTCWLGVYLE